MILFFGKIISAQKIDNTIAFRNIEGERYFRFSYDNDFFTATDMNYTQGYNFELVSPFFSKNPINKLFYKPKESFNRFGLTWEHIGFTPANIVSPEIQYGDRPFASSFMLKSFMISTNIKRKSRFSSALNLGIIGPAAFGEWMQVEIHKATGNVIPYGWRHQIKNHLVINYEVGFEKQLFNLNDYVSVQTSSNVRLGTLFTDASIGASAMLGVFNSPFNRLNEKNFQLYLFAQPLLTVVAHDATLQGGVLSKKKSSYVIESSKINRFRTQGNAGIVMKVGGMYFEYTQSIQSKEFKGASYYRWGGVKAGFEF